MPDELRELSSSEDNEIQHNSVRHKEYDDNDEKESSIQSNHPEDLYSDSIMKEDMKEDMKPSCPFRTSPDSFFNNDIVKSLIPIITSLLNSRISSSLGLGLCKTKESCYADELLNEFNDLWSGLDNFTDNKIRAICFMNNLNKFHDHIWSYAKKHSSKNSDETKQNNIFSTTLDLTSEKLCCEINNVMEQLNN